MSSSGGNTFSADLIHQNGSVVLRLTGELDLATAPALHQAVTDLVSPHLGALVLDVEKLSFVDVIGLRAMEHARRAIVAGRGEFRLRGAADWTRRVIRLAGFDGLEDAVEPVRPDPTGETPVLA
jgi:anti-sigma B factor antagonist